jgi:hypothetical protein
LARFGAPVLPDGGDAPYGSLGVALPPVVLSFGRDHTLAAFEPFRSLDYFTGAGARIRHLLHEIAHAMFKAGNYDWAARRCVSIQAADSNFSRVRESCLKNKKFIASQTLG